MKKQSFCAILLATFCVMSACNKQQATAPSTPGNGYSTSNESANISSADVSNAVTQAVSGSASGLATQSGNTAIAASSQLACGVTSDTVISGSNPYWSLIAYNYNLNFSRTCICTNGTPTQYNINFSGTSSYNMIVFSSADTTSAAMTVSGINSPAQSLVLNGTYSRRGVQQSAGIIQHAFSSNIVCSLSAVTVAKSTNQVTSGTANVQFTGTDSNGKTATHSAVVTFLGNNEATLVIDNGSPQTISW